MPKYLGAKTKDDSADIHMCASTCVDSERERERGKKKKQQEMLTADSSGGYVEFTILFSQLSRRFKFFHNKYLRGKNFS